MCHHLIGDIYLCPPSIRPVLGEPPDGTSPRYFGPYERAFPLATRDRGRTGRGVRASGELLWVGGMTATLTDREES